MASQSPKSTGRVGLVLGLVAGLFTTSACGPTAQVDRVGLDIATGGSPGGMQDAGSGGAGGGEPGSGGAMGPGGALGTGGAGMDSGAGTGGATPYPGTGGAAGTGGSSGTGGSNGTGGAAPSDAGSDDVINRLEPLLNVSSTPGTATTNLTSAGKLDWMHWGLGAVTSAVNRKKDVSPLITARQLGSSSGLGTYDNRPVAMTWTDGMPTSRATDSTFGLVVGDDDGEGFELKVTGTIARPRTLKLHVGGWQVRGKLTATIGGVGGRSYSDTSFVNSVNPGSDRIYTIVFQPTSDAEVLVVRWTVEDVLLMYGNITLQAATLSE